MLFAKLVQVLPGIQAGVMSIIEDNPDSVMSNRFQCVYSHIFLAGLQDFLARSMASHFGRRRVHPQVLERQFETSAVTVFNRQLP